MTTTRPQAGARPSVADRVASRRWWVVALGIYAATRLVVAPLLVVAWRRFVAHPGLEDASPWFFVSRTWDARWYGRIGDAGYPSVLPTTGSGSVVQNEWAFFPGFPWLTRAVMEVTRTPWNVAAPAVSLVVGALAAVALCHLVRATCPALVARQPLAPYLAVAAVSCYPASYVFNVAYSDSTALLTVVLTLLALHRRRYALTTALVVVLAFVRPVVPPLLLVLAWHYVVRRREAAEADDPDLVFPRRERLGVALTAAAGVLGTFAWPVVCAVVTGRPGGYFDTQAAWNSARSAPLPFLEVVLTASSPWLALGAIVLGLTFVACLWLAPTARLLAPELRAWGAAYTLYTVSMLGPTSSTPRYLLLSITLPLLLVLVWSSLRGAALALAVCFGLQVSWLLVTWSAVGPPP